MTIYAPITYGSLRAAMAEAKNATHPIAIRYPNASENELVDKMFYPGGDYENFGIRANYRAENTPSVVILTYGGIINKVISAVDLLKEKGISAGIILMEKLKPYEAAAVEIEKYISSAKKLVFVEEGIRNGGAGMLVFDALLKCGINKDTQYVNIAIDDNFASPTEKTDLYTYLGMSAEKIAEKIIGINT